MPIVTARSKSFQRLKTKPLRTSVFEALRGAIIAGRLRPGDPIREVPLGRELGVSQNTVREALLQLEARGLVVRTPNKQTTVTNLSRADIWERVCLRIILEPYVSIRAARQMGENDFRALDEITRSLTQAVKDEDWIEMGQADLNFHRYIWQKSSNRLVYHILDQACVQLFAFVSVARLRDTDLGRPVVSPHEDLCAALRSKDRETIFSSFRKHLLASYERYLPDDWDEIEAPAFGVDLSSNEMAAQVLAIRTELKTPKQAQPEVEQQP